MAHRNARPAAASRSSAVSVSWDQVHAFRLRRHHLTERAPARSLAGTLRDMGGAQAQLSTAAELSLWARTRDLEEGAVEAALWTRRRFAKVWCMRRTLHLLPSDELAMFVRGTAGRAEKEIGWMRRHLLDGEPLEQLLTATLDALDAPLNRTELAQRVAAALGTPFRWGRGGGWGNDRKVPCVHLPRGDVPSSYLLDLVGARGVVCAGPAERGESTFVRADAWLPRWRDVSRPRAEDDLLRAYLRAYGPATVADFVAWTRIRVRDAEAIWARIESELREVVVDGWRSWILRSDRMALERADSGPETVRLLPHFDSYLLGHMERRHLLDAKRHRSVYRSAGWISPVLLVNGQVRGTWSQLRKTGALRVVVRAFEPLGPLIEEAARREATELGRFLGVPTTSFAVQ
ncbi:MAG TPA: winged helix DNA-binding domain-containing protein [Thermoplasmata archaeon]|nr:winged helix DNA-binding domain-containing protein [Thermoplasmata archaeon]